MRGGTETSFPQRWNWEQSLLYFSQPVINSRLRADSTLGSNAASFRTPQNDLPKNKRTFPCKNRILHFIIKSDFQMGLCLLICPFPFLLSYGYCNPCLVNWILLQTLWKAYLCSEKKNANSFNFGVSCTQFLVCTCPFQRCIILVCLFSTIYPIILSQMSWFTHMPQAMMRSLCLLIASQQTAWLSASFEGVWVSLWISDCRLRSPCLWE